MYRSSETLDFPLSSYPRTPGLRRRGQNQASMRELLQIPFEIIELETRRELGRVVGGGGFDPNVSCDQQPDVVERRPLGRITIANFDLEAAAFTSTAIDAAHRPARDLLRARGRIGGGHQLLVSLSSDPR